MVVRVADARQDGPRETDALLPRPAPDEPSIPADDAPAPGAAELDTARLRDRLSGVVGTKRACVPPPRARH
jgi:hypothetical protein